MGDRTQESLSPGHLCHDDSCLGSPNRFDLAIPPANRSTVNLPQKIVKVRRNKIDQRWVSLERFCFCERTAVCHSLFRELNVSLPLTRQRPCVCRNVRCSLLCRCLIHRLASARHWMRRTNVRARRHRRDVSRDRDQKPSRSGACATRTNVDDNRCLRLNNASVDLTG